MKSVKIAYIGLGRRGTGILKDVVRYMADADVVAVCDLVPSKVEHAKNLLKEVGKKEPVGYTDYQKLLSEVDCDAVFVMTGWNKHVEVSLASLRAGHYTAVEVGTAYDLSECFALVQASEESGKPLMMLENCCYGQREMAALRMIKEGLFGTLVHAEGGYHHYLPHAELFMKNADGTTDAEHYRLTEYASRNCENYPTHELGPICKALSVGRGNRMVSLSAFASRAVALGEYMKETQDESHPLYHADFIQGDVVDTIITCAHGETIHLQLDTTLPRPNYNRAFEIRGTMGGCVEHAGGHATFWAKDVTGDNENLFDNEKDFLKDYNHPLHDEYVREGARGGHGGIDWLVCRAFIEAVKAGTDTPINAYDTAAWMAVGPLSEMSVAQGGAPVAFPDFTHGAWMRPKAPLTGKYSLDLIVEDKEIPIFHVEDLPVIK